MIDWDLSERPTVDDVDWPKPGQSVVEFEPVDSVAIKLPEGLEFRAGEIVKRVFVEREGDRVTLVRVHSDPSEPEDAYRVARDWAGDFDLPLEPLDKWIRERRSGAGDERSKALTTARGETIGPQGPAPSLEILYSFDRERPSYVSLALFWKPARS